MIYNDYTSKNFYQGEKNMGLIGNLIGSVTSGWRNQSGDIFKEFISCDALENDVMIKRGSASKNGKNNGNGDNIISKGSVIVVAPGQAAIIIDNGAIVDFTCEEGAYRFDKSTAPSLFSGGMDGIIESAKAVLNRATFGGGDFMQQRVYYVNMKQIIGNKYGTVNPIPFRDTEFNFTLNVRCNGQYVIQITDPILFFRQHAGNVNSEFRFAQIEEKFRSDLLTNLQPAFAEVAKKKIMYDELPGYTAEIADALNAKMSPKWAQVDGLSIVQFGINSVTARDEDVERLQKFQSSRVYGNVNMAAGELASAQADALRGIGEGMKKGGGDNASGMMAFMAMNGAQSAGGVNAGQLFQMGAQQNQQQPVAATNDIPVGTIVSEDELKKMNAWKCACGTENTGKFCRECGTVKPARITWMCDCGSENVGKFCNNCGKPKPPEVDKYKCNKCGWEPEDITKPPKFCPECGDQFNEEDVLK